MSQSTAPSVSDNQTSRELGVAEDTTVRTSNRKRQAKASSSKMENKKVGQGFRTYSDEERIEIMRAIAAKVRETNCTFKDAIKSSGISEQTYYQWKKLKPSSVPEGSATRSVLPKHQFTSRSGDKGASMLEDAPDILKLQQENLRLRQIFAEKLQAANDELRKRIALL